MGVVPSACLLVSCGLVQKLVGAGGPPNPPEDCKPLARGCACAESSFLAAHPRALCPGNGPPPPPLATGAAGPAAAECTLHGRLVWPAYLQAFFLEVCDPFELWGTLHLTPRPLLSRPPAVGARRSPSGGAPGPRSRRWSTRSCSRYRLTPRSCAAVGRRCRTRAISVAGHRAPP